VASASATVYDCGSLSVLRSFDLPGLTAAALSPTGSYLQTFQKSSSPQVKNVTVWHVDTATALYQHYQKNLSKATWFVLPELWCLIHASSTWMVNCTTVNMHLA
jgi:translation initiation factor 2A